MKAKIEGEKINKKSEYRKISTGVLSGKKPNIGKGENYKQESNFASNLTSGNRNKNWGFHTLCITISEACKFVEIKVLNKNVGVEGN